MPPLAIAGAGLAVGGALSYVGAKANADAQQNIAQDQLSAQQQQQQEALKYAQMTPQEMKAMEDQLGFLSQQNTVFGQNIQNSAQVLSAVNPAFISAGQNAVDMMNGKAAPTLAPLQKSIDQQREQLQTQLSHMYGPGWQSSSAGIEAMQRFEQGAQSTIAGAQQSYLGTLLGSAYQGGSLASSSMNNNAQTMSNMFTQAQSTMADYNKMSIGALTGFNTTQYQGADQRGSAAMGSWMNNLGNGLMGMGAQGAMMSGMSGMGGGGGGGGGALAATSANNFGAAPLTMPEMGASSGFASSPALAAAA